MYVQNDAHKSNLKLNDALFWKYVVAMHFKMQYELNMLSNMISNDTEIMLHFSAEVAERLIDKLYTIHI